MTPEQERKLMYDTWFAKSDLFQEVLAAPDLSGTLEKQFPQLSAPTKSDMEQRITSLKSPGNEQQLKLIQNMFVFGTFDSAYRTISGSAPSTAPPPPDWF